MTASPAMTLDQLGVPNEIRERAKMLWIFTLVGGLWGWIICNFVWKVEGQDQNEWYQRQLKQAMVIGGIGWVLSMFMGIGWFVSAVLSFLGFQAIGKGEDFIAPVVGEMILKSAIPSVGASEPAASQPAASPQIQNQPAGYGAPAAAASPAETEPIPFEKYVELSVATEAAAQKGWDINALLGQHGLTATDWSSANAWWQRACASRAGDAAFMARWEQLKTWYEGHYR